MSPPRRSRRWMCGTRSASGTGAALSGARSCSPRCGRFWLLGMTRNAQRCRVDPFVSAQISVDASIQYREHFLKHWFRRAADVRDDAGAEVDALHLLHHHHPIHVLAFRDRDVEGIVASRVRHGTRDAEPRGLVEQVVADDERGAPATLFVSGPVSYTHLRAHETRHDL